MDTVYKKFLVLAVFLMGATLTQAQDFSKYKISFKLNPNVAWMVPQDNLVESVGAELRFGYGVNVDILFTENYAIGTGMSIESNGGRLNYNKTQRIDSTNYIVEKERNYNLKYVEVPLTLKLRTNEIGYITYYGQFGLGLGVNVSAKADDEDDFILEFSELQPGEGKDWRDSNVESIRDSNINIKDDINLFRTSLIIGAGIEYNLQGNTSIVAGLTFNNGFSNVLNDTRGVNKGANDQIIFDDVNSENGASTQKIKASSNFFAINVGILF